MRAFRVYFNVHEHVPAASYRYVFDENRKAAKAQVKAWMAANRKLLKAHNFELVFIEEEEMPTLGAYLTQLQSEPVPAPRKPGLLERCGL